MTKKVVVACPERLVGELEKALKAAKQEDTYAVVVKPMPEEFTFDTVASSQPRYYNIPEPDRGTPPKEFGERFSKAGKRRSKNRS